MTTAVRCHWLRASGGRPALVEAVVCRRASNGARSCNVTTTRSTEYRRLHALSLDARGATTYEALLRRVWGGRGGADPQAVRTAIRKLRRKLGDDAGRPKYILTVRGLGYRMPTPDEP